ncbi:unnamed protein product [Penicillium salamii]|uniref:EGF domain-specific O-linked N-acetylglucosamine transferase n=1 Tax=Penicillium salamii TaxID=1612424 RepID=A0A9W4JLA4_9EURO|nr:unnamed protein product [Penicillium salamii]CAG8047294.1 unnamed protein product [Penicillium salamii]CAG8122636.1 unnamed protein product [Penicillium salamii]CAG8189001.1 unnamed protein product [Penicillium salamii]CAG8199010.1 unnamed protein product [Penicillium salamii]
MWYGRLSGTPRGIISASFIIIFWVLRYSIPPCIHCSEHNLNSIKASKAGFLSNIGHSGNVQEDPRSEFQPRGVPAHQTQRERHFISRLTSTRQTLDLPQDYLSSTYESTFCESRFGVSYLEDLHDSAVQYCTTDSHSDFTCFHSQTIKGRVDSLCIGRNAIIDPRSAKFNLECELRMLPKSNQPYLTPEYGTFQKYMSDTGPRVIMDNWVHLERNLQPRQHGAPKYTILVKREGATNLWHSLLEAFSMSLTMDVLQISSQDPDSQPFYTPPDTSNTQVILLDDHELGPYVHMWSMFADRPMLRLKDLAGLKPSFENIILPLAGGSNPLWQSNPPTEGASCEDSALIRIFSRRVLDHYKISKLPQHQSPALVMTFIDRAETRVLLDHTEYLEDLGSAFPDILIQEFDFATISFEDQLEIVQKTNILVGVHGAGLTHAMFLPPRSTVVEIIPDKVDNRAYENLASLMGHSYLSAVSSRAPESFFGTDWHAQAVSLEKAKFKEVLSIALKAMFNRNRRG